MRTRTEDLRPTDDNILHRGQPFVHLAQRDAVSPVFMCSLDGARRAKIALKLVQYCRRNEHAAGHRWTARYRRRIHAIACSVGGATFAAHAVQLQVKIAPEARRSLVLDQVEAIVNEAFHLSQQHRDEMVTEASARCRLLSSGLVNVLDLQRYAFHKVSCIAIKEGGNLFLELALLYVARLEAEVRSAQSAQSELLRAVFQQTLCLLLLGREVLGAGHCAHLVVSARTTVGRHTFMSRKHATTGQRRQNLRSVVALHELVLNALLLEDRIQVVVVGLHE